MANNRTHFVTAANKLQATPTTFLTWTNFDVLTHLQELGGAEIEPILQTNQDGILLDFGYKLETSLEAKVLSLDIALVANNAITGERWEFDRVAMSLNPNIQNGNIQVIDSDFSRNYLINSASPYNLVSLESTALVGTEQMYEGVAAQKITWQDYIANNNVAALFFNNAFPNNNRNQKTDNYSNESDFTIHLLATARVQGIDSTLGQTIQTIERLSTEISVFDYFESDDGVVATGDIQAFDETETTNLGNEFITGQRVLFRTEWSGPNPLNINSLGYVLHSLEPKNANSNLQIEESSTFRGTAGGALSQVIAVQDGNNIVSRCFIDTSNLNLSDYTFSARIQTPGLVSVGGGYALLDFKSLNGRNIVFTARVDILTGGRAFSSVNNEVTTADLSFRIGDTTAALNDANNAGWSAFPVLTWVEFNALAIPIDTKVRCEYNGISTVTDLPCRIKCLTDEAPTAIVTNTIFANSNTAANNVLLSTETQMSVSAVISQFGTSLHSAVRTDLEIANSSDLTDFAAGIGSLSAINLDATGHLFARNTTISGIGQLSIQTTSADANLGNIVGIASPLQNFGFPTTADGTSLFALEGDAVNDLLFVPAGVTGGDLLYPSNMALNEERSYTWLGTQNALGDYQSVGTGISEFLRDLGNSNIADIYLSSGLQYRFEASGASLTGGVSDIKYVTFTYRRKALIGAAADMYDVEMYVNTRFIPPTTITGTVTTNTYNFGSTRFNLGLLNALTNIPLGNSFRSKRLNFVSVHKRVLTKEEIENIHLGADVMTEFPANYYYDLTNLVVDGANRTIPNLGTDAIDDARLENNTNTLTPLF